MDPYLITDFLDYLSTIRGKSPNTVREYRYDLRRFVKYMILRKEHLQSLDDVSEKRYLAYDAKDLKQVTLQDLFSYIGFLERECGNGSRTRSRKVASIRALFKYYHQIVNVLTENPAERLESPKNSMRHPQFLTLDESIGLLEHIQGENAKRDYAIIMLFLNCGMRISELVGIDIDRIKEDTLTVIGKGNKERTIYLNEACIAAIGAYLAVRPPSQKDKNALFLSKRKERISVRAVQHLLKRHLLAAGLDPKKYSPHKLRHTAATLMYQHGHVDIRALQQILGHESVATTQIYTHIDDDRLRQALNTHPLSQLKKGIPEDK
ncbi:tyrosine recombinase XerC [Gottschalkiaceae bacterium SANA]|nr:tyrosine recombinase XerC [Gottschalkiaceae bacterium SANA]